MTPLTPEQRALAGDPRHIAFARRIARRMAQRCPREYEQIEAAALAGLVRAARHFDPERGVLFPTFAERCIAGEVVDALRELGPKGFRRLGWLAARGEGLLRVRSLSDRLDHDRYGHTARPQTLGDTIPDPAPPVAEAADAADFVTGVTTGMPPAQRAAVRLYYLHAGLTMKDIAHRLGLSESRVSQLITQAQQLIRERLEARGLADTGPRLPRRRRTPVQRASL